MILSKPIKILDISIKPSFDFFAVAKRMATVSLVLTLNQNTSSLESIQSFFLHLLKEFHILFEVWQTELI